MGIQRKVFMLTTTLQRELEITIESALMLAEPDTTVPVLAQRIYDSSPELMAQCEKYWALERIAWMLYRRKRRLLARRNQLTLPGFENLPRLLTMRDGTRKNIKAATLPELLEYREVMTKNNRSKLEDLDRLISLVSKHSRRHPRITVMEAIEAEQEKQQG